jgi:hypothetical protein
VDNRKKLISILLNDEDDQLELLIRHIQKHSAPGHSFDVVVDPESSEKKSFGIDGDGWFQINKIVVRKIGI